MNGEIHLKNKATNPYLGQFPSKINFNLQQTTTTIKKEEVVKS